MTKEEKKAVKAAQTLLNFCKEQNKCGDCVLKNVMCDSRRFPSEWDEDELYNLEKE